jgi:hypothetical protein
MMPNFLDKLAQGIADTIESVETAVVGPPKAVAQEAEQVKPLVFGPVDKPDTSPRPLIQTPPNLTDGDLAKRDIYQHVLALTVTTLNLDTLPVLCGNWDSFFFTLNCLPKTSFANDSLGGMMASIYVTAADYASIITNSIMVKQAAITPRAGYVRFYGSFGNRPTYPKGSIAVTTLATRDIWLGHWPMVPNKIEFIANVVDMVGVLQSTQYTLDVYRPL